MNIRLASRVLALAASLSFAGALDDLQKPWTEILSANVKGDRVDYAGVLKDKAKFDAYLASLAALDSNTVKAASKEERVALYVNAYNAAVFQLILKNPTLGSVPLMPAPISGANVVAVAQESLVVADIARKKVFGTDPDPLLWSLLCDGTVGASPILNRAVLSTDIPSLAEERTRLWLADTARNKIDAKQIVLVASPFDIFRVKPEFRSFPGQVPGFVKKYGPAGAADPEKVRPTYNKSLYAKNSVLPPAPEPKAKKGKGKKK